VRGALPALLAAAVLAGCGGDDGDRASRGATPDALVSEAKHGLDQALAEYRDGDRDAAAKRLASTRDEDFAGAERDIRAVDAALAARLHNALYDALPKHIEDGVTVSALAEELADVEVDLDDAVVKLRTP
jgi:hypothetical protein